MSKANDAALAACTSRQCVDDHAREIAEARALSEAVLGSLRGTALGNELYARQQREQVLQYAYRTVERIEQTTKLVEQFKRNNCAGISEAACNTKFAQSQEAGAAAISALVGLTGAGIVLDLADVVKSIMAGEYSTAALNALFAVPGLGDAAKLLIKNGGGKLLEVFDRFGNSKTIVVKQVDNIDYHVSGHRADLYDDAGKPTHWINPLTGNRETIPEGVKIHQDHIYPKSEFNKLPGWDRLTADERKLIEKDPVNLQPLTASTNCSKGARVCGTDNPWETYRGEKLPAAYTEWLKKEQDAKADYLTKKIAGIIKLR